MKIVPFRVLRPTPERVEQTACPPYDVMDSAEARAIASEQPASFVRVIRPEVTFEGEVDEHDARVYGRGREVLDGLVGMEGWVEEEDESLWVYRLTMAGREQVGVYACVPVEAYDEGSIVRHEKTRVDKEDDRTRHVVEQQAHAEPVMLTYSDDAGVDDVVAGVMAGGAPMFALEADGVRHELWRVAGTAELVGAFGAVERMYVADGHHRCAAASRAARQCEGVRGVGRFPAVVFPMGQMKIWPYHRVVWNAGDDVVRRLGAVVTLEEGGPEPRGPGWVSVYAEGGWWAFRLPEGGGECVADGLDVARLADGVLRPVFGIEDPRTDRRLSFVGGIRGTGVLERAVREQGASAAFSMWPTSMVEFQAVSDAGELMPPKSTWFEPKLRSGILVHRFGREGGA